MAWKRVATLIAACQALHYAPPQHTRRRQQIRMQATATAARPAKLDTLVGMGEIDGVLQRPAVTYMRPATLVRLLASPRWASRLYAKQVVLLPAPPRP